MREIETRYFGTVGIEEEKESGMDEKVVELEAKDMITYDDFDKCQFQVGLVLECKESYT